MPPELTVRDYFAAMAMSGMVLASLYTKEERAKKAYEFADAMLKEREKYEK